MEGQEETKMQAIRRKLRSQRGASITFALLIFLVCAVVGSVVLAAGTVTSGRLAGSAESGKVGTMVEMERRYHAVNSAAELLKKELTSGKTTATITKTTETTTKTTSHYDVDANGNVFLSSTDTPVVNSTETYTSKSAVLFSADKLKTGLPDLTDAEQTILKRFARETLIGGWSDSENVTNWKAPVCRPKETTIDNKPTFTITVGDNEDLAVDAAATFDLFGSGNSYTGDLTIDLENHKGNQKYCVRLQFSATNISWKSDEATVTTDPAVESTTATKTIKTTDPETGAEKQETISYISQIVETTKETVTETKSPIVTWKLVGMKVLDQKEENNG